MVSFVLLTTITAALLPVAICADLGKNYKEGTEWRFLDHFVTWTQQKHPSDTTLANKLRAKGTFWNSERAKAYKPLDKVSPSDKKDSSCIVTFYYPTMPQRGLDSRDPKKDRDQTWGVPFAVNPVCGKDAIPSDSADFPDHDTEAEVDVGITDFCFTFHKPLEAKYSVAGITCRRISRRTTGLLQISRYTGVPGLEEMAEPTTRFTQPCESITEAVRQERD
jgi:hypothetical protein